MSYTLTLWTGHCVNPCPTYREDKTGDAQEHTENRAPRLREVGRNWRRTVPGLLIQVLAEVSLEFLNSLCPYSKLATVF